MSEQIGLKSESGPEKKSSVLEYLAEKNRTLINDYKTPDGNYAESCGLIAIDVARMLLEEGKRPTIVSISGKPVASTSLIMNEPLVPVRYEGKISWGGHLVCVCDGLVYDPMLGEPIPVAAYAHEAFGTDVEMKTYITEDRIEEFVKDRS